ncbi:MAG: hypothetical protein AMJ90_04135 [candidate division Zixibacteria bacterium SM23_73_2]|nr:MAG: hypothetical protein AMJ90_04135 [candidate division Zixibacteria bacterium SM23_73_2]
MAESYLIDIEGTIVTDKSYIPVPGALEWIRNLRQAEFKFALVTNNTTHPPKDLLQLLWNIGFELDEGELESCMSVALDWLLGANIKKCFAIGSNEFKKFLKENGIKLHSPDVQAVLVGLDQKLNYNKLKLALSHLVKNDAQLLALHVNKLFTDQDGKLAPSVGAVVKALEYSSGKKAYVLGKPSSLFFERVIKKLKLTPEETMMISDDPLSDLLGAKKMGMKTCFVLSGKYKDEKIVEGIDKNLQPDFIYDNITQIEI